MLTSVPDYASHCERIFRVLKKIWLYNVELNWQGIVRAMACFPSDEIRREKFFTTMKQLKTHCSWIQILNTNIPVFIELSF